MYVIPTTSSMSALDETAQMTMFEMVLEGSFTSSDIWTEQSYPCW